jgi:hypothetical protein
MWSAGFLMKYNSKRTLILYSNYLLLAGLTLSQVDEMHVICGGKLLIGLGIGGLSVYCPRIMNEVVPTEIAAIIGSSTHAWTIFGSLIASLLGASIPERSLLLNDPSSYYVQSYWRTISIFPLFTCLAQIAFFQLVMKHETPYEMRAMRRPDWKKIANEFSSIYSENQIDKRVEEIKKWKPISFAANDPVFLWARVWYEQRYTAISALVIFFNGVLSMTVGSKDFGSINRFEAVNYTFCLTVHIVLFYYVLLPPLTWLMKRFRGRPWMIMEFGVQCYMAFMLVIIICVFLSMTRLLK